MVNSFLSSWLHSTELLGAGPFGGVADVDIGFDAGLLHIGRTNGVGEGWGLVSFDEVHGAAGPHTESLPPRKPGAWSAASTRASSAGELLAKSSRLEACEAVIKRPSPGQVAREEGLAARMARGLVLIQDVSSSQAADRVELVPGLLQVVKRHVSQSAHLRGALASLKVGDDPLALLATLVVLAVDQVPRSFRVTDDDRGCGAAEWQSRIVEAAAIEPEGVVGPAEREEN